jgi:hypothetical protein
MQTRSRRGFLINGVTLLGLSARASGFGRVLAGV